MCGSHTEFCRHTVFADSYLKHSVETFLLTISLVVHRKHFRVLLSRLEGNQCVKNVRLNNSAPHGTYPQQLRGLDEQLVLHGAEIAVPHA